LTLQNRDDELVGPWILIDDSNRVEQRVILNKDGSAKLIYANEEDGSWKRTNEDEIIINLNGTNQYKYEINDGILKLMTDVEGSNGEIASITLWRRPVDYLIIGKWKLRKITLDGEDITPPEKFSDEYFEDGTWINSTLGEGKYELNNEGDYYLLKGIPGEDGEKKILEDQQKIQESLANQGITSFSEFDPDPVDVEVVINDQGNIMILKVREQQGYDVVYRQEFEFQRVN
jgi:hypothetical protein